LLKLENVNNILKYINFRNDSNFDLSFEFLKFSKLTNEVFINEKYPISFDLPQNSKSKDNNINLSAKSNSLLGSPIKDNSSLGFDDDHNKFKLEENTLTTDSYDNTAEKVYQVSSLSNKFSDDIYTFGGYVVGNKMDINNSHIAYSMGTTANIALIKDNFCYIANVGDSLAVIYKDGKAIKVNAEHKVTLQKEKERIIKSNRKITNGRIDGKINLARAIGDFAYKNDSLLEENEQSLIAFPEIYKFKIPSDIEFLIMGCDGLWDYADPQKVCNFVSKMLKKKIPIKIILKEIFSKLITKNLDTNIGSVI